MTHDIAAALLRDVKRHGGWHALDPVPVMYEAEVLAALSRALDPALTERAGEVLEALLHEERIATSAEAVDFRNTADLITALLAQNAALRAERDRYLRHLTAGAESLNAYKARAALTTEAERDNLSDKLELERALTDGAHRRAAAAETALAASEARVAKLVEALTLAANRLSRRAVEYVPGGRLFIETGEWADEARATIAEASQ